jgi:hypothetical protein
VTVDRTSGRAWAYTGVALGGLVSIAANVAHSFVPPDEAPAGWSPEPGAVVGAIVWPVFLFIAVEILARTAWPNGRIWWSVRWTGLVPVALVAALVSYRHLSGLLAHYGEEDLVVWLGPLAVDGLMVMATGALLATGGHHTQPEPEAAPEPAPAARLTAVPSMTPAPVLTPIPVPSPVDTADPSRTDEPVPSTPDTDPSPVDTAPATTPEPAAGQPIPTPAAVATRITPDRPANTPAISATMPRPDTRTTRRPRPSRPATPARPLAPSTTTSVTASHAAQRTQPVVAADLLARADRVARQYRTEHGTPITPGQLAVRLKVTSEQATQALAVIGLAPDNPTTPITTVNGNRPDKATTR